MNNMNTIRMTEIYGRDAQRQKIGNDDQDSGDMRIVMHRDDCVSFLEAHQTKTTQKGRNMMQYILFEVTDNMLLNMRDALLREFPLEKHPVEADERSALDW